jgi:hypothetical protein
VVAVGAIGQEYIGERAPMRVLTVDLEDHVSPEDER